MEQSFETVTTAQEKRDRKLAYYRDYYRRKVDLNKERERKQQFYAENREMILNKARERYQKKKLAKIGVPLQQTVEVSDEVTDAKTL